MKTLKKTLCLVLAVVMAVGVLVIPANAATFTDDAEIEHDEAVAVLSGLGIVNGVGDGSFNPDGTFTRAQAAALLANVVLTPEYAAILDSGKAVFSDVPVTSGYNKYITWANEAGYIHGYTDGTFKPNKELTGLELAALMLEVLGEELDASNYKNFVNTTAKRLGLTDGIEGYVSTKVISRDDAVQMMFNTMNYSADAKTVYKVVGKDTDETYYGTYNTMNEALTIVALLGGIDAAEPVPVENKSGSIFTDVYEATHTPTGTDSFKRPVNTWKDSDGNTLYSLTATPAAEYSTNVKYSKIYADLGLSKAAAVSVYMFGQAVTGSANVPAQITYTGGDVATGSLLNYVGNGTKIEVYADGDGTYTMVIIPETFVKAGRVTTSGPDVNGKTTVTQQFTREGRGAAGGFTTTFSSDKYNNFARDTFAILNVYNNASGTAVVASAEAPEVVTGVLSKIVTSNGVPTYTIGGRDFNEAIECDDDMSLGGLVGQEISVYVDPYGYILGSVAPATAVNKYINVLACSGVTESSNWMVGTRTYTQKVYGVLSTGEYGEYTVSLPTDTGVTRGVYVYNYNTSGNLVLTAATGTLGGKTVTTGAPSDTVASGSAYAVVNGVPVALNSATIYYFYTTGATGAISSFDTRTGNTNAGVISPANATFVVEDNVVKFVFVGSPFNAGITTLDMAYINTASYGTVSYNDGTTSGLYYTYTGYTADGKITLNSTALLDAAYGSGIYAYNSDMTVGARVTGDSVKEGTLTIIGSAIGITDVLSNTTYYNYDADNVAFIPDGVADLANGQTVIAVVNSTGTSITHLWVITDAPVAG